MQGEGTPDFSTAPRSKSETSTWNGSPQRELTTNPLSGMFGADQNTSDGRPASAASIAPRYPGSRDRDPITTRHSRAPATVASIAFCKSPNPASNLGAAGPDARPSS